MNYAFLTHFRSFYQTTHQDVWEKVDTNPHSKHKKTLLFARFSILTRDCLMKNIFTIKTCTDEKRDIPH